MISLKPQLLLLIAAMILVKATEQTLKRKRETDENTEILIEAAERGLKRKQTDESKCRKNFSLFGCNDFLQLYESFLEPRNSFQMKLTNEIIFKGVNIKGKLNVFPNESSVKVFRDLNVFPPKNEITWEDPDHLMSSDRKENIERALLMAEKAERPVALFEEVSRQIGVWDWNHKELFPFYKKILMALAKEVDHETRKKVNKILLREFIRYEASQDVAKLMKAEPEMDWEEIIRFYLGVSHGHTALTYAANNHRRWVETIRALLDGGAKVNGRDMQGDTAVNVAALHGNFDAVNLLIDRGADVNSENEDRETSLMNALKIKWLNATKINLKIIKILLDSGANVNSSCKHGYTALIWAAQEQTDIEIFELLLNAGAEINVHLGSDKSPLYLAAERGKLNIVQLLLKKGATDADKKASEIAASNGHDDCADAINEAFPTGKR